MFSFYKMNNVGINAPAIDMLNANPEVTYKVGDALVLTNGLAAKASGTTAPTHVAAGVASDGKIAAYKVQPNMEFKTTFSADASAVSVGNKVTIGADSETVTATTASGVATIVEKLGTGASGTEVIVTLA